MTLGHAARRRASHILLAILLLVGAFGYAARGPTGARESAGGALTGAFWSAQGPVATLRSGDGVRLQPHGMIRLIEAESDQLAYRRVRLQWKRETNDAVLDLRLREDADGMVLVRLGPPAMHGVLIARKAAGGDLTVLERRRDVEALAHSFTDLLLEVELEGGTLRVKLGDQQIAHRDDLGVGRGAVSLLAHGGSHRLQMLAVEGERSSGASAEPFQWHETFLPSASLDVRACALRAAHAAMLLVMLACLLRLLCRGKPSGARLARATAVLAAPLALFFGVALVARPPASLLLHGALLLASTCALLVAAFVLRRDLAGDARDARGLALALAAASMTGLGTAAADYRARFFADSSAREAAAHARPDPAPYHGARMHPLGAHNAITLPHAYRDFDLTADVSLDPESLLEVRVRAPAADVAEGLACFLGTDAGFPAGFFRETRDAMTPLGDRIAALTPSVPMKVRVAARGRGVTAWVDGREVAACADRTFTDGAIVLLAARGSAQVGDLRVEPHASVGPAPGKGPDRAHAVAGALLTVLAGGLLLAWAVRLPVVRGVALTGIVALPVALLFALHDATVAPDPAHSLTAISAAALFFVASACVHGAALTVPRFLLLVAFASAAALFTHRTLQRRPWPPDTAAFNRLDFASFDVDRVLPRFQHLLHPLVRRANGYLARHEFRGRSHTLHKRPGVQRVAVIGTSSAFGYAVEEAYGHRLERLLGAEGTPVDVMVAAVQGSAGARLFCFFRDVVTNFAPDVVIVSLFYNDSAVLAQCDERALLRETADPAFARTWWWDLRLRAALTLGRQRYARFSTAPPDEQEQLIPATGQGSPSDSFEATLRDFAQLCKERGIDLVLMKEPTLRKTAHDRDRPFKAAFYAAHDRVAAEFRLRVVDPGDQLKRRGGAALFMDPVHPLDAGHAVIAEMLRQPVRELLLQRR